MIKNLYKKKNQQTFYFYHYFFLLIGFFGGNLWGSFFSSFYLPPFFFVIGILLCLEILSYIYYKKIAFPCRSLPFDTPACSLSTPFWERPRASRARSGLWLRHAFRVRPYPTDTASSGPTKGKALQATKGFAFGRATDFSDLKFNRTKGFSKKKLEFTNEKQKYKSSFFVQNRNKSLYLLKVGLVFGLFVDAFKVGS